MGVLSKTALHNNISSIKKKNFFLSISIKLFLLIHCKIPVVWLIISKNFFFFFFNLVFKKRKMHIGMIVANHYNTLRISVLKVLISRKQKERKKKIESARKSKPNLLYFWSKKRKQLRCFFFCFCFCFFLLTKEIKN